MTYNKHNIAQSLLHIPKVTLRNCAESVANLKQMFEKTSGAKYTDQLHADIGKLLPKFKTPFRKIEEVIAKDTEDEDILWALATKIDAEYETYNECKSWFEKLVGKKTCKRQRSI